MAGFYFKRKIRNNERSEHWIFLIKPLLEARQMKQLNEVVPQTIDAEV